MPEVTVEQINRLLPQTQCEQCGYKGCKPYAEAISNKQAAINQCPPGGQQTIDAIAKLLGLKTLSLNQQYGSSREFRIAKIDESVCIGCVKCIRACPVDAIIGAAKQMHIVLIDNCTGCELCIEPCPVDCIDMVSPPDYLKGRYSGYSQVNEKYRLQAKDRYENKLNRLEQIKIKKQAKLKNNQIKHDQISDKKQKQAFIKEAIKRNQNRKKSLQ